MVRSKKLLSLLLVVVIYCMFDQCFATSSEEDQDDGVEIEAIPYESPPLRRENVYFSEHFDNPEEFKKKWIPSKATKPDVSDDLAKYDGKWDVLPLERFPLKKDRGLVMMSESRHSAISSRFAKPFRFNHKKPLIVQYTVAFQNNHDCGGAYLKLLTEGAVRDLTQFNDKSPYSIMFGPDKCGGDSKIHFIIRHKHPVNGTIIEKHCKKLKAEEAMYTDKEPFLLKLIIKPDNTYQFFINNNLQNEGLLLDEDTFDPPIVPPKEIIDENDKKPNDWDDRPKIPDPTAVKPDDWDETEPPQILDPNAQKPEGWLDDEPISVPDENTEKPDDWEDDIDGEWEPPLIENPLCKNAPGCGPWSPPFIENPKFKGPWKAPLIDNPDYKGKWVPKKIPNPDYYHEDNPLRSSPIDAIGFELWSLVNKIYFDDILVTDDEDYAEQWTESTWVLKKRNIATESVTWRGRILKLVNFNPGWWLTYAVYCCIPLVIYFIYMKNILEKKTYAYYKSFLQTTNDNPWLWAVYIVVLAIVVGLIGMCFVKTKSGKQDYENASVHKKTDENGVDDDAPDEEDDDAGKNDDDNFDTEDQESEDNVDGGSEMVDDEFEEPTQEKEDEANNESENETAVPQVPSTPRKRRPRKD